MFDGVVVPVGDAFEAPLSGKSVVWFKVIAEEDSSTGSEPEWKEVFRRAEGGLLSVQTADAAC